MLNFYSALSRAQKPVHKIEYISIIEANKYMETYGYANQ